MSHWLYAEASLTVNSTSNPVNVVNSIQRTLTQQSTAPNVDMLCTDLVGPFQLTGGTFVNVWWYDLLGLAALREVNKSLFVSSSFIFAQDENQQNFPNPPIHFHHVKVSPSLGQTTFFPLQDCFLRSICMDTSAIISYASQHRDTGCLTCRESVDLNFSMQVSQPWAINVMVDDARPEGSSPLSIWLNCSSIASHMLLHGRSGPISMHQTWSPSNVNGFMFFVPIHQEAFVFYVGKMPFSGTIFRTASHWHTAINTALLFSGLLLGLPGSDGSYKPTITTSFGFANNDELMSHVLRQYSDTLVCQTHSTNSLNIANWSFTRGSYFTALAFLLASSERISNLAGFPTNVEHFQWYMLVTARDGNSHATVQWTSTQPDVYDDEFSRMDLVRMISSEGASTKSPLSLSDQVFAWFFLGSFYMTSMPPTAIVALVLFSTVSLVSSVHVQKYIMQTITVCITVTLSIVSSVHVFVVSPQFSIPTRQIGGELSLNSLDFFPNEDVQSFEFWVSLCLFVAAVAIVVCSCFLTRAFFSWGNRILRWRYCITRKCLRQLHISECN